MGVDTAWGNLMKWSRNLNKDTQPTEDYELSVNGCESASVKGVLKTQFDDTRIFKSSAYNLKTSARKHKVDSLKQDDPNVVCCAY